MIVEREFNRQEAASRLYRLCQHLNLVPKVSFPGHSKLVATCTLTNLQGSTVSAGAGKGEHCDLGALAESIEHYVTESQNYIQTADTRAMELLKADSFKDDWLIKSVPDWCVLPTCELQSIDSDTQLCVPAILLSPTTQLACAGVENPDLAYLVKYSTNSGTGLGCSENEALLHALNETIERHALSVYYLYLCGLITELELNTPSQAFLDRTFSAQPSLLKHCDNLHIYLTRQFYDLYFCIAVGKNENPILLSTVGSGCSSDPGVALYRAITEQLQCETLKSDEEVDEDDQTARFLANSGRLSRLIHPVPQSDLKQVFPNPSTLSVRTQLKNTLIQLKKHHRGVYLRTLFNEPGLGCVLQVYIPGLERFHLIRCGSPVVSQSALSKGARDPDAYL